MRLVSFVVDLVFIVVAAGVFYLVFQAGKQEGKEETKKEVKKKK